MKKTKKKAGVKKAVKKKSQSSVKKSSSVKKKAKKSAGQKSKVQKPEAKKAPGKKAKPALKTKKRKRGGLSSSGVPGSSTEESKQWEKQMAKHKDILPKTYDMAKNFKSVSVIKHKEFGLGFIESQYNNRLKVLFKEGMKILVSNYKNK